MRLRSAAWWTAAVAAALAAGAAAILLSFDLQAYRDQVVRAVADATGRSVAIDGELSLALSLRPKLVAEGVTLGNPPGFSRPEMVRIGRLEAEARLWPLLQGEVVIDRLALEGVDLLLERGAEGRGNWSFAGQDDAGSGPPPRIGRLVVRDAVLGWRSEDGAWSMRLDRLEATQREGAIEAELEGAVEGRPARLAGSFVTAPPRDGDAGPVVIARHLAFGFGEVEGWGELTVVLAPERPRLDGALKIATLDLDRLLGPGEPAEDGRLIPDAPLDRAALGAVDLALAFEIGRLAAAGRALEEISGRVRLEAGRLALSELSARIAQGRLTGSGEAQRRGEGVAAGLKLDLAQAELAELVPGGPLSGRIDVKLDVKGQGASLRALASSLAGEARLLGRDGRIEGRALDLAAADLLRLLAPWTEGGDDTRLTCMLFASTIRDGRAHVDALAIDSERVLVTGEGVIDLGRERLDLELTPRPKDPSLLSLATPVDVRGPLAAPSVSPDEAALARSAAGALLGNLVLPGAGFLLPFLSAGAEDHPCAATLKPTAAGRRPAKEEEGGVGGFLRGLGGAIDRALGGGR